MTSSELSLHLTVFMESALLSVTQCSVVPVSSADINLISSGLAGMSVSGMSVFFYLGLRSNVRSVNPSTT